MVQTSGKDVVSEAISPVDIVILSWGRVHDTCAAINSALSQIGIVPKVYVIDQGTESKELQILKSHCENLQNVTLICNDHNKGVPGGRNQGTALGSSAYVVALDNDAEFASGREIAKAVAIMESDPSIAALAFRILLYASGEDDRTSWPYPLSMQEYSRRRFVTARFVGAGHMLRRSTFEAVGGYDSALIFLHEEVDLSYRLINTGGQVVYEPSICILHKVAPENRVSWSGKRYYFHVRNIVYMAAKYNFSPLSGLLGIMVAVAAGFRSGFVGGTTRGLLHGLSLVPKGLYSRFFDPRVRLSAAAKHRLKQTSPTRDMSAWEKLLYRLRPLARLSR